MAPADFSRALYTSLQQMEPLSDPFDADGAREEQHADVSPTKHTYPNVPLPTRSKSSYASTGRQYGNGAARGNERATADGVVAAVVVVVAVPVATVAL